MSLPQNGKFIGRHRELVGLQRELDRQRASLVVLYGRRRVGKSTLLSQAIAGRAAIYYQATQVLGSTNLALLKDEIQRTIGPTDPVLAGIDHWESLLSYVADLATRQPGLTLVLDEFPYLCEAVDALPSIVQKVFDRVSSSGLEFNLILCGSQISFMEELLGERNPLRGRQTHELELLPLTYREAASFFPEWSPQDRLTAYGVFGGLPYYLQLCDPDLSLRENIETLILEPSAPLSNEAVNVLRAELSSPARYATILEALANGCTSTGDILGRVKDLSTGAALTPYITRLEALRLLQITHSFDASPKARNRRYSIADPFLAFWYRFVLPNSSALTTGHAQEVYDYAIEPYLNGFMGEIFEWIAHQFVAHYGRELLSAPAKRVGKIWSADYDIDLAAALLDSTIVFGECKWWDSPVGPNVLKRLQETSLRTKLSADTGISQYMLFSRSGFTKELHEKAKTSQSIVLVDPQRLLGP